MKRKISVAWAMIIAAIIGAAGTIAGPYVHPTIQTVTVTELSLLTVTVTSGPSFGTVPDVVGENIRTAERDVAGAGFRPNSLPAPSEYAYEKVFDQQPKGGARYPANEIVNLYFSAGNKTYPTLLELTWGEGVSWGPQGFEVKGALVNLQALGNRSLYVVLHRIPFGPFWVQERPRILPNGEWAASVSYGLPGLEVGTKFELFTIVTKEKLVPGESLSSLPPSEAIMPLQLLLSSTTTSTWTATSTWLPPTWLSRSTANVTYGQGQYIFPRVRQTFD